MGSVREVPTELLDELKASQEILNTCRQFRAEIEKRYRNDTNRAESTFDPDFSWIRFYSMPYMDLVALYWAFFRFCTREEDADLLPELSTLLKTHVPEILAMDNLEDGNQYQLGIFVALSNNIACMQLHGKSLNRLLQEYASQRTPALLKKIVKFDRAILAHPYIARDIAIAELTGNTDFFHQLKLGLSGSRSKKTLAYGDLRYLLVILEEMGLLAQLSGEAKYQLFCVELSVYPASGSDPKKGLERQIQRIQSEWAT